MRALDLRAVRNRYEMAARHGGCPVEGCNAIDDSLPDIPLLIEAVEAADALWTALRNAKGEPFGPAIVAALVEYEERRDIRG